MSREELKGIVFKTHSPLTVEEVMFGIDKYVEQIREHIVNQCIFIVIRNSSNGYRDIDGDWVEPYCNTRDVIDEMEQLKEQKND